MQRASHSIASTPCAALNSWSLYRTVCCVCPATQLCVRSPAAWPCSPGPENQALSLPTCDPTLNATPSRFLCCALTVRAGACGRVDEPSADLLPQPDCCGGLGVGRRDDQGQHSHSVRTRRVLQPSRPVWIPLLHTYLLERLPLTLQSSQGMLGADACAVILHGPISQRNGLPLPWRRDGLALHQQCQCDIGRAGS